jgi:hypothetical protein
MSEVNVNSGSSGSDEPNGLRSVLWAIAGVGVTATVVAAYFFGHIAAVSVGFGALLGLVNLLVLGRMVRAFLSRNGASLPWIVAATLKLAVLLLALYLPVRAGVLELFPFMCGFGALPIGIVAAQFLSVPSRSKAN